MQIISSLATSAIECARLYFQSKPDQTDQDHISHVAHGRLTRCSRDCERIPRKIIVSAPLPHDLEVIRQLEEKWGYKCVVKESEDSRV